MPDENDWCSLRTSLRLVRPAYGLTLHDRMSYIYSLKDQGMWSTDSKFVFVRYIFEFFSGTYEFLVLIIVNVLKLQ